MKGLAEQKSARISPKEDSSQQALDFIGAGVGCACLVSLSSLGLIDILLAEGVLSNKDTKSCDNPEVAQAAINTLLASDILIQQDEGFL